MLTATTERTDHGRFVAAARWARDNGLIYDRTDMDGARERRWRNTDTGAAVSITGQSDKRMPPERFVASLDGAAIDAWGITVQDAVDFLVVAGVLPVELASWASVDGITATMRALHMTAIDLRPAFDGVGEAS